MSAYDKFLADNGVTVPTLGNVFKDELYKTKTNLAPVAKDAMNGVTTPTPALPVIEGANGPSNSLATSVDTGNMKVGKAALASAQDVIDTQKQAARMGEQSAQKMLQANSAASSALSGGLGSAAMNAAAQSHLNNINAYNSQLAAWQQGVAGAQQNLAGMQAGFASQDAARASDALGNVQSAQAAGSPTTIPVAGSGGAGGSGGDAAMFASTKAQDALNTGATTAVDKLTAMRDQSRGKGSLNLSGVAGNVSSDILSNIQTLQQDLGLYTPGTPEYAQVAKALQVWERAANALVSMGIKQDGTYQGDKHNNYKIPGDLLSKLGVDPWSMPLPNGAAPVIKSAVWG